MLIVLTPVITYTANALMLPGPIASLWLVACELFVCMLYLKWESQLTAASKSWDDKCIAALTINFVVEGYSLINGSSLWNYTVKVTVLYSIND